MVPWREEDGRLSPYFSLVRGEALLHAEDMGTVEWGAIVTDTACRWVTEAAPQPMRSPPACHRFLRAVPPLNPRHALTREAWRAMLSHPRKWREEVEVEEKDGDPGLKVPAGTVTRAAHSPHAQGPPPRGARPGAGTPTGASPAGPHSACGHVRLPGPPGMAAPR